MTDYSLFPYQREVYEETRVLHRQGARSIVLVMPTGAGKTRLCAEFIINALRKGISGPVVWVTHTVDLVDQARRAFVKFGIPSEAIGTIAGGSTYRYDKPIQIAIMAKLIAIVAKGGLLPQSPLIIPDEGHHYVSDTYLPLIEQMRAPGGLVLLPTATPERSDGRPMEDIADAMVVGPSVKRLTALKRLVPCLTHVPVGHPSRHLAAEPLDAYLTYAKGRMGLLFGSRVDFLQTEADKFTKEGIAASVICDATPRLRRKALLEAFELQSAEPLRRAGFNDLAPRVLCSVGTLTEGVDVPAVSAILLTQLHRHTGPYIQRGGRGLRAHEGKEELVLVDLCGNREAHGNLEDDRVYSLKGKAIRRSEVDSKTTEQVCRACGAVGERRVSTDGGVVFCPHCGEARKATPIEVRERELQEAGRIASISSKARTFIWFLHEASKAGHARGRAVHRYTSRYGDPPWADREVWAQVRGAWDAAGGGRAEV